MLATVFATLLVAALGGGGDPVPMVDPDDLTAILALRNDLIKQNAEWETRWPAPKGVNPCAEWEDDVECNGFGAIIGLALEEGGLTSLPVSVTGLTNLLGLAVEENELSELPEELGEMENLLGLEVGDNPLSELPESFSNLNLLSIDIDDANFAEFPAVLLEVTSLLAIDMDNNPVTEIPDGIVSLQNLEFFDLDNTMITEITDAMTELSSLEVLDVEKSPVTEISDDIGNLSNLEELDLEDAMITELPESIGWLSKLEELDLEETWLEELPSTFDKLFRLKVLDLETTRLEGELPAYFANFQSLEEFGIDKTNITAIPRALFEHCQKDGVECQYDSIEVYDGSYFNIELMGEDCSEGVEATVDMMTPGGAVRFVYGKNAGEGWVQGGPCDGTPIYVAAPSNTASRTADGDGMVELSAPRLAPKICGYWIQAIDMETCEVSNLAQL